MFTNYADDALPFIMFYWSLKVWEILYCYIIINICINQIITSFSSYMDKEP